MRARPFILVSLCLLVVVAILAPHSLSAGKDEGKPVEKAFSASFDHVWGATLRVLQQRAEPMGFTDRGNGIMSTDYKSEEKDKWRHKFSLLIMRKGENEITVSVTCVVEKRSGSVWAHKRGKWKGKKSDGKREEKLLDDIERQLESLSPEEAYEAQGPTTKPAQTAKPRVQIKPGMTHEEVIQLLGEPQERLDFGDKIFLRYSDIIIELLNGKVVDVKMR